MVKQGGVQISEMVVMGFQIGCLCWMLKQMYHCQQRYEEGCDGELQNAPVANGSSIVLVSAGEDDARTDTLGAQGEDHYHPSNDFDLGLFITAV